MIERARRLADGVLNSEGRSTRHILLGVGVTLGAALIASSLAARGARPVEPPKANGARATTERPKSLFSVVLPALMSATTLSALRVWNAPASPARGAALRFWGVTQAVNALWLAIRPRSAAGQMLAAMTTAGATAAYAHEARKLDRRAGVMSAPHGRGVGLVNMVGEKLKSARHGATLH